MLPPLTFRHIELNKGTRPLVVFDLLPFIRLKPRLVTFLFSMLPFSCKPIDLQLNYLFSINLADGRKGLPLALLWEVINLTLDA